MKFDVFCNVIDNFGDAGVCLRLCRSIKSKGHEVNLYCDDLNTLLTIATAYDTKNIGLFVWNDKLLFEPSDVTILAFSCRVSDSIVKKLKDKKTLVINLEYLSAERWVEDFHALPSYQDSLKCFYFFPGFTKKTGGLVIEDDFKEKIKRHKDINQIRKVSLFSYENKNVKTILNMLERSKKDNYIQVFSGKGLNNLNDILGTNLKIQDSYKYANISIDVLDMVPQPYYDDILINSDLNLVRGEDSIVRAMLTGNIFLWQIYYQDEKTHIKKLNEFFNRMQDFLGKNTYLDAFIALNNLYNDEPIKMQCDFNYDDFEANFKLLCKKWSEHLISLGSLSDNLIDFCHKNL